MQAAFYVKQGPAREVLEVGAQPTPEPGPGEVRVRVSAAGLNPVDWKIAASAEAAGPLTVGNEVPPAGKQGARRVRPVNSRLALAMPSSATTPSSAPGRPTLLIALVYPW